MSDSAHIPVSSSSVRALRPGGAVVTASGPDSPEGRSRRRYRRVAVSTATSAVTKIASVLTIFISAPLAIHYLGVERYGMWMAIASAVTMLSFSDLGIGNGLLTLISETDGSGDREAAQRYVSSAFCMLSSVAILITAVTLVAYPYVKWQGMFHVVSPEAIRDSGPTFLVLIGCFALNMPLGITLRIQSGYQEGYTANLWSTFGSLLALAAVVFAIHLHAGLPWLVLGFAGAPVFALLLNTIWLFARGKPWLRPSLRSVHFESGVKLFRMGILFFVLQVSLAVGFQSDSLVIARVLGAEQVALYSLTARIFSTLPVLLTFMLTPLWPAYGEAFARGDIAWLRRALYRSLSLSVLVAVLINTVLLFTGRAILKIWIGPQIVPSFALLIGLAISQTLFAVYTPLSVLLNGLKILRPQAICFASMAVVNITASVYLTHRIGISGVVYGSIIAQVLCMVTPAAIFLPRLLNSLGRIPSSTGEEVQPKVASFVSAQERAQ